MRSSLPSRFVLTKDERQSPVFIKLMKHWTERLAALRASNDSDRSDIDTAKLRGKIAECKTMLSLNEDLPVIE